MRRKNDFIKTPYEKGFICPISENGKLKVIIDDCAKPIIYNKYNAY